uniref:Sema domain, immunoglobulin domain (Ig), short basic domain, secreted, (semaphorin) 3Aa n=1 Tax=Gouania willdenowi TaxID=441366 RepID=A0A8C5DPN1_GOUWI
RKESPRRARRRHRLQVTSSPLTAWQNSSSYDTFLMDEERGRLLVGAEDHIFSFDLVNINRDHRQVKNKKLNIFSRDECKWAGKDLGKECSNFIRVLQPYNQTHLYICGTGAFHPICAYLEMGKRSLLNLISNTCFSLADGELYSGTSADFMGRDFAIFRTLGDQHPIRTEQHDSRWLNDPRFIGVNLIPESDNPEDDKIFLFFKENAMDGEHTGKATIARIGQLCKNDMGGHRSLVNKWTTFLKARLMCSVPGLNGIDTHFDELQDVFLMSSKDPKNPVIYGVFTTSRYDQQCACITWQTFEEFFLGPYAHRDGPTYQWVPFQGRVPYLVPCPSKTFGGFDSTKDLPDDVITFARGHPAMYNPVLPIRRPSHYGWWDRVEAEDGQEKPTATHVIHTETFNLFYLTFLLFWFLQQQLYLGSALGVSQMSLHRCEVYGKACAECCLARDPYCAWDGAECSRYFPTAKRRTRRQDIRNGDPLSQCSDLHVEDRSVFGVENSSMFLECSPKSQRALIYWQLQKPNDDRKIEIKLDDRVVHTDQGLLIRSLSQSDTGIYHCQAVEHGFIQPLLRLNIQVIPTQRLGDILPGIPGVGGGTGHSAKHRVWYRDFLSLLDHPELNSVEEFCDRVWKKDQHATKWRRMQENKKGRNRRTHELQRPPRSV